MLRFLIKLSSPTHIQVKAKCELTNMYHKYLHLSKKEWKGRTRKIIIIRKELLNLSD